MIPATKIVSHPSNSMTFLNVKRIDENLYICSLKCFHMMIWSSHTIAVQCYGPRSVWLLTPCGQSVITHNTDDSADPIFCPHRRFPVEEIPEDEQECSTWLHTLYQEKVTFSPLSSLFIGLMSHTPIHIFHICCAELEEVNVISLIK